MHPFPVRQYRRGLAMQTAFRPVCRRAVPVSISGMRPYTIRPLGMFPPSRAACPRLSSKESSTSSSPWSSAHSKAAVFIRFRLNPHGFSFPPAGPRRRPKRARPSVETPASFACLSRRRTLLSCPNIPGDFHPQPEPPFFQRHKPRRWGGQRHIYPVAGRNTSGTFPWGTGPAVLPARLVNFHLRKFFLCESRALPPGPLTGEVLQRLPAQTIEGRGGERQPRFYLRGTFPQIIRVPPFFQLVTASPLCNLDFWAVRGTGPCTAEKFPSSSCTRRETGRSRPTVIMASRGIGPAPPDRKPAVRQDFPVAAVTFSFAGFRTSPGPGRRSNTRR